MTRIQEGSIVRHEVIKTNIYQEDIRTMDTHPYFSHLKNEE
jgi:hypothetical protein